jgi:predicted MPP superfamily phosphohydrolase
VGILPSSCHHGRVRTPALIALGTASAGVAGVAYSYWEAKQYTLRRATAAVLPAGQRDMRILHLSDLHLVPGQTKKQAWVRSLRDLRPDAVVVTGDFMSHVDGVPHVLDTLDPLFEVPGMFVLGSNDYYAPKPLNPVRYLQGPSQLEPSRRPMLPWRDLVDGLTDNGWLDLGNARTTVKVDGREIDVRGVDDPHISRDRYDEVAGPFDVDADLTLGITHAPYLRVLDGMAGDGADLIFAGHTHGGQVCVPGIGALVTNCDLDRKRAKGLSRHGDSALHVSAGLGTSPYAPIRFACRPEATLLTLTARP